MLIKNDIQRSSKRSPKSSSKKVKRDILRENQKNTTNPTNLWTTLKQLGLLNKRSPYTDLYQYLSLSK